MGLLTDDIMEQEQVTCGALFEVKDVYAAHSDFNQLGGHGFGLFPMKIGNPRKEDVKAMIAYLPLISDSKHRLRLDPDTLIKFAAGCYRHEIAMEILKSNPKVSISSTQDEVYYVVESDYEFEDNYNRKQILSVTLKKF